jgi:hypothetical protein
MMISIGVGSERPTRASIPSDGRMDGARPINYGAAGLANRRECERNRAGSGGAPYPTWHDAIEYGTAEN